MCGQLITKLLKLIKIKTMKGKTGTLLIPYNGYKRIEIIRFEASTFQWVARILGSGKEILVYADEFILD